MENISIILRQINSFKFMIFFLACTFTNFLSHSARFTTTSYQCSKAALNMMTKCFAYDVQKIVFVAMHPGWVQTDMGSTKDRSPPVPIEESAQGIIKFAHEVPLSKSGCFIGFDGNSIEF